MTEQLTRTHHIRRLNGLRIEPDTIPILGIAGTRGKSTVAWMLAGILQQAGRSSGSWLSSGVYVDNELETGELGPWSRVVLAARHGEIDVALQEMSASTVVGAGLPLDTYPMAILTTLCGNNESCLLNPETALQRRGLETVVRAVRSDGLLVANADDWDVYHLAQESASGVVLFALHQDNPVLQPHLARGGYAAWVAEGALLVGDNTDARELLRVEEIPATLDGAILFQVQNALAAAAAASLIGVSDEDIAAALRRYQPDPGRQPAACNLVRFNHATIVIDAPRFMSSLRLLARGIRHKPHRRRIVVSGTFLGMTDDEAHDAGRILGGLGGVVLLHGADAHPERVAAIKAGIASSPVPPIVMAIGDEQKAIDHVLNTIAPGDVALVLADEPERVLAHLWPAPLISIDAAHRPGGSGK